MPHCARTVLNCVSVHLFFKVLASKGLFVSCCTNISQLICRNCTSFSLAMYYYHDSVNLSETEKSNIKIYLYCTNKRHHSWKPIHQSFTLRFKLIHPIGPSAGSRNRSLTQKYSLLQFNSVQFWLLSVLHSEVRLSTRRWQ